MYRHFLDEKDALSEASSAADTLVIFFFYFYQKTGFDISCKFSLSETICMKFQISFSGNNKKNISNCHLLKSLPRVLVLRVKQIII